MDEQSFKALPLAQRKAHQERLQALGLYVGKIDGNWGPGTKSAFDGEVKRQTEEAERAQSNQLEQQRIENERLRLETERGKTNTANAESEARLAKQKTYTEQEMSPLGMATQSGATLAAPALAGWAGLRFGDKVNKWMDEGQKGRNVTLRGAADDRIKGLTTREGAVTGAKLAGAMPPSNTALRVGGRMAPHLALTGLSMGKGAQLLSDVDEDQAFYPRMADRAAGLGYIGFGGGILKRGIQQAQSPGVSPDAQALSVINSSQLRRNNAAAAAPDAPQAKALTPRGALVEQAKAAGIKNVGKKNMGQLQAALEAANKGLPKAGVLGPLAIPAAAGALAFGMTPSDAQASTDGGSVTGEDRALTNAGLAAGGTALASRYAGPVLGALGRSAGPLTPFAAADLSDTMSQEDLNTGQNWLARNAPVTRHLPGSSIGRAYDMAQVPERSPVNAGPRRSGAPSSFEQALSEFQALISAQ